jgi:hypothetical protein
MRGISTVTVLLILIVTSIVGCSSGQGQRNSDEVVLNGMIVYPDTTIVDDRIISVKLNPGPDTLRVGGGQFRINAPFRGEYQVIMKYPNRSAFPPLFVSLGSGVNRLSFMIPREEQIPDIIPEREEQVGEETRIIIIRP